MVYNDYFWTYFCRGGEALILKDYCVSLFPVLKAEKMGDSPIVQFLRLNYLYIYIHFSYWFLSLTLSIKTLRYHPQAALILVQQPVKIIHHYWQSPIKLGLVMSQRKGQSQWKRLTVRRMREKKCRGKGN